MGEKGQTHLGCPPPMLGLDLYNVLGNGAPVKRSSCTWGLYLFWNANHAIINSFCDVISVSGSDSKIEACVCRAVRVDLVTQVQGMITDRRIPAGCGLTGPPGAAGPRRRHTPPPSHTPRPGPARARGPTTQSVGARPGSYP